MRRGASSYPETVKFLEALLEGVLETQYLEIRTFKSGGVARKSFYPLSRLHQEGIEVALPGHLDGQTNVY